ncbi:trimethyllysine dioxygenase, mitochondrial-like isoform X2 [Lytechinus variegatus]|uniref:trimethyllysine dioxygenase, mitochondrial-like isoform X2 n=1 Tax=Lytechinus variegatus TaxID=7654 RepID=UPI001BB10821|nr:trimethyllysine dioxygenase, mitochondrial-like isoform X2 [Lytechinus variegatus]
MLRRVPSSCLNLLRNRNNLITRRTFLSLAERATTSDSASQTKWLCSCPLPTNQTFRATRQGRLVTVPSLCRQSTSSRAAESTIAVDIRQENDHLSFSVGNENFKASYLWLRDHCRCSMCYEEVCHENFVDIVALPDDIRPKECHYKNEELQLIWPDDHVTTYSIQWLRDNAPGQRSSAASGQQLQPFYWDKASLATNLPEDVHIDALREGPGLKQVMENLHVQGFTFISGIEATREATEAALNLISRPMPTLFGDTWCYQNDGELNDAASLNVALKNHTDTTYNEASVGGLALHCIYHDGTGGENTLIDGFHAANILKETNPEHYETLLHKPVVGHYLDDTKNFRCYHNVLRHNVLTNQLQQIRFNPHDRLTLSYMSYEDAEKFYAAYRAFGRILESSESKFETKLQPGRMVLFDNWRLLHGRAGFTGKRVMVGCYFSNDDIQNLKRTTANLDV